MPTHVALLRGINVGRGKRLAMADLRDAVEELGHTDVATYIASGNVVFTAAGAAKTLAAALERAVADMLGGQCAVVVLPKKRWQKVLTDNPYSRVDNPRHLHAGVAQAPLTVAGIGAAVERATARGSRDEATVVGGTLYLHTPDGLGHSVLAEELGRGKALADVTMRNWATVAKLLSMLES